MTSSASASTFASIIENTKGRFFTVLFVKNDGSLRKMNARTGVTKYLKGGSSNVDPAKYFTLYDVQAKGYRSVNKDSILEISANKVNSFRSC